MEADPSFLYKLCVECCVDQCITAIANLTAFGFNPLAWTAAAAASAILLHFTALLNDIVLVWFLAPVAGAQSGSKPKISHAFQDADGVTLSDRVGCFLDKMKLYAPIGFLTAVVGGALTVAITGRALTTAALLKTGVLGATHLGLSANARYQCVNGIEQLMAKTLPSAVSKVGTICVRTSNNFLGARVFLLLAALFQF